MQLETALWVNLPPQTQLQYGYVMESSAQEKVPCATPDLKPKTLSAQLFHSIEVLLLELRLSLKTPL